jgi:tellurite resistance protein
MNPNRVERLNNFMEGFQVGNKLVATPGLSQEDIVKIEEQKAKEDLMLQGVTEETLQIALTPEQEAAVSQVCSAIDLSDGKMITTYGLEDAKTLDKLTEKSLSNVRSKDAGDTGALLLKLTNEIAVGQDTDTTGFFGFIRSMGDKAKALQIRYESVQDNINRVKAVLERNIVVLNETSLNMEDMIKANKENYQRLTVYVTAGKQKLNEAYEKDIPELEALASKGGQEEAEKLNALKQATNLFALQVADLEAQMALSMSLAIQLTNMNYANYALIQRTNRTINNMIPAWRISMAAAIAGQTTLDAYEVDKKVNDGINEAIRKASDKARETVGAVVRHAESTGLTAETIEYATSNVLKTLDEINEAQTVGRKRREEASLRIGQAQEQIRQKLLTTIERQKGF